MKTVTIRDVPDELHAQLKLRAEQNRRSLNQQIIAEPEQGTPFGRKGKAEAMIAKADELRAGLTYFATAEEIDEAKRYGRK